MVSEQKIVALNDDAVRLLAALRAKGIDDKGSGIRHCIHEASHALDVEMTGKWTNIAISAAMKRIGPGRAAQSEILARVVEQIVCKRLNVVIRPLDIWIGLSVMEATKFRDPFLDYTMALEWAKRVMESPEARERADEIMALASLVCSACGWKSQSDAALTEHRIRTHGGAPRRHKRKLQYRR